VGIFFTLGGVPVDGRCVALAAAPDDLQLRDQRLAKSNLTRIRWS
jgi:hypothetical protein